MRKALVLAGVLALGIVATGCFGPVSTHAIDATMACSAQIGPGGLGPPNHPYADETAHAGKLRVQLIDPGATRTRMRQNAFPGEEPSTLKTPDVVATAILERLLGDSETGSRVRID